MLLKFKALVNFGWDFHKKDSPGIVLLLNDLQQKVLPTQQRKLP
jgi:hypothetical protein